MRRLADQRHLVLDHDDAVVMAHPFATVPLGFAVMGTSTLWWGGCAWDSFAISHTWSRPSRTCWSRPDVPAVIAH
jgi:hypothetical protein